MQASFLAIAGIVSRIIGLLYRGPLSSIIGDLGLGYYQSAYNFYTIILLVSSYSIPSAISKIIAQKLALKEYRNAHRIFLGAFIYVLIAGLTASMILYFGASLFVQDAAVPVLRVFAPTIFIYGILGVLRGYFQAHRTMVPTSISQLHNGDNGRTCGQSGTDPQRCKGCTGFRTRNRHGRGDRSYLYGDHVFCEPKGDP